MKRLKVVTMLCCFALMALAFSAKVQADTYNKKTTFTFSAPFEVPGVDAQVLPAGTYVFKLLDSMSDRNIVQIFNANETHVYTTILAIPNYRLKATDKTVLTFGERAAGSPEAIKAWFYPGETWGQEFVYPKKRALELAKIVNEPVLAAPVETYTVSALKTIRLEAVKPTGEEVPVTEVVELPPPTTVVAQTLPRTASSLPLFGLIGLLSLCAGFALLNIAKRAA